MDLAILPLSSLQKYKNDFAGLGTLSIMVSTELGRRSNWAAILINIDSARRHVACSALRGPKILLHLS